MVTCNVFLLTNGSQTCCHERRPSALYWPELTHYQLFTDKQFNGSFVKWGTRSGETRPDLLHVISCLQISDSMARLSSWVPRSPPVYVSSQDSQVSRYELRAGRLAGFVYTEGNGRFDEKWRGPDCDEHWPWEGSQWLEELVELMKEIKWQQILIRKIQILMIKKIDIYNDWIFVFIFFSFYITPFMRLCKRIYDFVFVFVCSQIVIHCSAAA